MVKGLSADPAAVTGAVGLCEAYNDRVVRQFTVMTVVWGIIGMVVGALIAAELIWPGLSFDIPWLSYGRLRPLHTNAVIFAFGGSALTGDVAIPKNRSLAEMGDGIPVTYVPARNTVFLSLALAWAESLQATDIFIGVNALDYSGYPDCRPEFIHAFETMANLGTKIGSEGRRIRIHTPLIAMTKAKIIRAGLELGVDYGMTVTCYDVSNEGEACGACDACLLRLKGFAENSATDPVRYRNA